MGVPAFFRWLNSKYPKITSRVIELSEEEIIENPSLTDSLTGRIDSSKPNLNGVEFDNLYLDMNGIIHPCCHPEHKAAPETEEDMYLEIFKYIDRLFSMIRPRKLLYMAIDGVAPRAKMNQQRSRRFRAAQEAKEKKEAAEKIREELKSAGIPLSEETDVKKPFDNNCITPGTSFMANLALALQYYIIDRLNNDAGWKNIEVILSDASVPGEGEHKIMSFIRHQRASPHHDPNTQHVLYGLDADLIMLALATHEPNFRILREDVFFDDAKKFNTCHKCGGTGHMAYECTTVASITSDQSSAVEKETGTPASADEMKPFIFLDVYILRQYLSFEFAYDFNSNYDFERVIDDWVFLCFFVGNDFLPHLPSMEIREGAIDLLMDIFKKTFSQFENDGYLTHLGNVNVKNVLILLEEVGKVEDNIFLKRKEREDRRLEGEKRRKIENARKMESQQAIMKIEKDIITSSAESEHHSVSAISLIASNIDLTPIPLSSTVVDPNASSAIANRKNMEMAIQLKEHLRSEAEEKSETTEEVVMDIEKEDGNQKSELDEEGSKKRSFDETIQDQENPETAPTPVSIAIVDEEDEVDLDSIKLWEAGAKERYYQSKFKVSESDNDFAKALVISYLEGLCWVMGYYYRGCRSWEWFFPYHYAPFASDFVRIRNDDVNIEFSIGTPFSPFEQLLGVLPEASKELLPTPYHKLMADESSEIRDFYPESFAIDMNGKKAAWQGVALLPFIEQQRLQDAAAKILQELSPEEHLLNTFGCDLLYLQEKHLDFQECCKLYLKESDNNENKDSPIDLSNNEKVGDASFRRKILALKPEISKGIDGFICKNEFACLPGSRYTCLLRDLDVPEITSNFTISAKYFNASNNQEEDLAFSPKILAGYCEKTDKILTKDDFLNAKFSKSTRGYMASQYTKISITPVSNSSSTGGYHSMHKDAAERNEIRSYASTHSYHPRPYRGGAGFGHSRPSNRYDTYRPYRHQAPYQRGNRNPSKPPHTPFYRLPHVNNYQYMNAPRIPAPYAPPNMPNMSVPPNYPNPYIYPYGSPGYQFPNLNANVSPNPNLYPYAYPYSSYQYGSDNPNATHPNATHPNATHPPANYANFPPPPLPFSAVPPFPPPIYNSFEVPPTLGVPNDTSYSTNENNSASWNGTSEQS